jgi:HK97 family phage major capsid protein
MTTPTPTVAGSPVTTGSFQTVLWPADVATIVNMLVGGAPFAGSLTRYPTARFEVAFPTASPDRPAWTAEGQPLPQIGMHDAANIVAVKKLGEIVILSNESVADTSVNLTQQFGDLLSDAAGPELDRGLLYGSLAPEPVGVVAAATAADGTDFGAAITKAVGQIGNAGGAANTIMAKPSVLANARNVKAVTGGEFLYPSGIGAAYGLTEVPCPEANDCLVYDATRMYLILRSDFEVALSQDYAFASDSTALRVRGRFAVGVPSLPKAVRKVTVAGAAPTDADQPTAHGKR